MYPVIEVQCPFCKTTGQIMTPPLGSIIVGPCPQCGEMVLLYDGTVMSLDKDIISSGTAEEKKQHILETILDMVADKVDTLVENGELELDSKQTSQDQGKATKRGRIKPSVRDKNAPSISREDVRDFVNIDLNLIDLKAYFDKIFRNKRKSER